MANSKKECRNKDCRKYGRTEEMIKLPRGGYVCDHECTMAIVIKDRLDRQDKAREKAAKEIKKKWNKEKKEYYDKDRPTRLKAAITAFNAYIRKRDENRPCISCEPGTCEVVKIALKGGAFDCGHYLTVGAFPELRFTEVNAHRQCKKCNGGSGKYTKKNHTVGKQYRINLIERIGIKAVEWIEGPHEPPKLTACDLKDIEIKYKSKLKELNDEIN